MIPKLLVAWSLMAVCVAIHATGMASVTRWRRGLPATAHRTSQWTWLLIRLAGWIIVLHLIEIALWAVFYVWQGAMPDLQSALYFSAVTYTTTGYGDLVLPREWQLLGGVEALTGILMGVVHRILLRGVQPDDSGSPHSNRTGARTTLTTGSVAWPVPQPAARPAPRPEARLA